MGLMLDEALFRNVTEAEKDAAIANVTDHAVPHQDFFLMLVLSVAMAALGFLLGSTVIVVAGMLIAPLLYPILALALGVIAADQRLVARSFYALGKSTAFALAAGFAIGLLFSAHSAAPLLPFGPSSPSPLLYALAAAAAGFTLAFAVAKPRLNETLPGVAVSVSLVPPLAAAGIALALADWSAFGYAMLLFAANSISIVFSAAIVFVLFRFAVKGSVAQGAASGQEGVIAQ